MCTSSGSTSSSSLTRFGGKGKELEEIQINESKNLVDKSGKLAKVEDTNNDESDESDEGVDMEGINVNSDIGEDDDDVEDDEDEEEKPPSFNDSDKDLLAIKETNELEEARKEQTELMKVEQKVLDESTHMDEIDVANPEQRFQYLIAQSEVFAHFLAGSVATSSSNKKSKISVEDNYSRSRKGKRLTEDEEDARLLASAQSKRRIVRLDTQPSLLAEICHMHAYQLEGLNWLIKLHDHGINGILADEMGLGKTLQTISLLAYLRESRGVKGPHLIIVPKSVVGNWIREINKWCPVIKAVRMGGLKEERDRVFKSNIKRDKEKGEWKLIGCDVLVTSYEGVAKEQNRLKKFKWHYLIIDEAHKIKNENSQISVVVRRIPTQFRLLLTGTPLQNNLHELWALLNFLLPDIFGSAEVFDLWFSLSGSDKQENVIRKLHTVLRPFMIRRVKKDVAYSLPPKKETKLYVGLTEMQQDWYKKVLRKEAFNLNSLGGPDKSRLHNILMQLRKVCNHPYLFDGAEPGPPYSDGPHIWESCGKLSLLHRLLPKLRERGSRVLIFSQMTRVLDIMEDYFRLLEYDYCRIDGNTDGEMRDSQMDEFNKENSTKFCFLLSTRAGGLGINLATADIVILYDSDWNPQVDLQAMDRAHRIGQKKPVQVFRFITEGTVEEKIIERADRKLFLDAAVIQQGRLAEQHKFVDKSELMKMVKFGADQILSGKGGTYTEEDIDALITKGEERTSLMQAKLRTDAQHNLASFSLLGDEENDHDTFNFGGENYRDVDKKGSGNVITLPQRERKRNYDVNEYFRETMKMSESNNATNDNLKVHAADAKAKKQKKGPVYHDFQLFDKEGLNRLNEREKALGLKKEEFLESINTIRTKAKRFRVSGSEKMFNELNRQADEMVKELNSDSYNLTSEEQAQRQKMIRTGFIEWTKKDFKAFCISLERYGRYDIEKIIQYVKNETGKAELEVKRYFIGFWIHYKRIADWRKIIDRIEKGEKKILRFRQIRDAIGMKIERHLDCCFAQEGYTLDEENTKLTSVNLIQNFWPTMKINYAPGTKNNSYTEEEDSFLLAMMHRHGYGATERIRLEIRRAWQFRFDWYFKSRDNLEIQKRCDQIVKSVEKEIEDIKRETTKVLRVESLVENKDIDDKEIS